MAFLYSSNLKPWNILVALEQANGITMPRIRAIAERMRDHDSVVPTKRM
jgi:hypothetical protein